MSVYSIDFAKKILKLACIEFENEKLYSDSLYGSGWIMNPKLDAAIRAVIYLSLLSCEVSLKALLEKAGMPVKKIRACSHDLNILKRAVGYCEIEIVIVPGLKTRAKAFGLFTENIQMTQKGKPVAESTVGKLLTGLQKASKYPDEIRYGEKEFKHYPPEVVIKMAESILSQVDKYWDEIWYKAPPS